MKLFSAHLAKAHALRVVVTVAFIMAAHIVATQPASAAFGRAMVRLDRMRSNQPTTGRICVTPSVANVAQVEAYVEVTFPAGFPVSGGLGNWTVDTANLDSGQTAWPGINSAVNYSSNTLRFPSSDLASSSALYCFNWSQSSAVVLPISTGEYSGAIKTLTSTMSVIDQSSYVVAVIANDQIQVSASVPPTLNFSLDTNAINLGQLDPASITTSATFHVTLATNAANGWTTWVKNQNGAPGHGALYSPSTGYTIAPAAAPGSGHIVSAGSNDYGLIWSGNTVSCPCLGTDSLNETYHGWPNQSGNLDPSSYTWLSSRTGPARSAQLSLNLRAAISSLATPANDYSDTLTIVAAGMF